MPPLSVCLRLETITILCSQLHYNKPQIAMQYFLKTSLFFHQYYGIIDNVTAPILVAGRGAQHGISNLICCLCCGRCSRILHLQMAE